MSDFVNFKLAKKLKEKGVSCEMPFAMYNEIARLHLLTTAAPYNVCDSGFKCREYYDYEDFDEHDYVAPTISQVLKWLRDKFSLHISQKPYACKDGLMWMYEIRKFNKHIVFVIANETGFVEEEEASLAGIVHAIDNLI